MAQLKRILATGKGHIPAEVYTPGGTITATGTVVVGTNTKFLTYIQQGSWISVDNQAYKVASVSSDTLLKTEVACGAVSDAFAVVAPNTPSTVSIANTGATDTPTVNGVVMPAGLSNNYNENSLEPINYDGTGGELTIAYF